MHCCAYIDLSICNFSKIQQCTAASGLERHLPEPLRRAGAVVKAAAQARLAAAHSAALIWWQSQRQWLRSWYVKVLAAGALLLGLATATANIWGVHAINTNVLPSATMAVSQALDREVSSAAARVSRQHPQKCPLHAAPANHATCSEHGIQRGHSSVPQLPSLSVSRCQWVGCAGLRRRGWWG